MPLYSHECRACTKVWLSEYNLAQYDYLKANKLNLPCPDCKSEDTYRQVNHVVTHFKGSGWSADGYYKYQNYDDMNAMGTKVTVFDQKEDIERVMKGERAEAMKRRLKKEDEAAKRAFGPDAALTEEKANKRIKKAVDKVKV